MLQKLTELSKDKKYAKPVIAFLFLVAIFLVYKKTGADKNQLDLTAIPIEAAKVKIEAVPLYISSLGTVTANIQTTIKAQVNGQLVKINFQDGQKVKKNDLLARIDSRTYKAELMQYEGQLLRDQAILDNSRIDLKRYQDLWKQNSTSKQTLDTQVSLVKQNEGIVQFDQGLVDNAKINLSYCDIIAPFDGQVGIALVNEGDLMQTSGENTIVVINSLNPISVQFTIPEKDLSTVLPEFNKARLAVEIYDQANNNLLKIGKMLAIDNQIDSSTGTVKIKAEFDNKDFSLFPNQFVNIKLLVKKLENIPTIPTPALQHGPIGTFVYLLNKEKNKVIVHPVEAELTNGSITAIKTGLSENDIVAVTGVDKLKNDAAITITGSQL